MDLLPSRPRAPVPLLPSFHPSVCLRSSNLFIPTLPLGSQCTRPRTEARCGGTIPLSRLCVGPSLQQPWALLKNNIMKWDIISKHPAGCHRSTLDTLGLGGAVFPRFFPPQTNGRIKQRPDGRRAQSGPLTWEWNWCENQNNRVITKASYLNQLLFWFI